MLSFISTTRSRIFLLFTKLIIPFINKTKPLAPASTNPYLLSSFNFNVVSFNDISNISKESTNNLLKSLVVSFLLQRKVAQSLMTVSIVPSTGVAIAWYMYGIDLFTLSANSEIVITCLFTVSQLKP